MTFLQIILHSEVHIHDLHIFIISSLSFHGFITNQFQRPAPTWLVSLIGRALHQYRRGQGFESRTSLSFRNCISCLYNCDDLLSNNSSLRSSHIWFSYIHNFKSETYFNQSEALWVVTPHWSSSVDPRALVRRRFSGEPVVVGHSQANRQSILKLSTHCFFLLLRDIFLRHTISLLSCHASEGVTNWLIPSKNLKYKNLKTRTICRMNFCIVCVCPEFENSIVALRCHWANEADFRLKAVKQMFLKERMIEP